MAGRADATDQFMQLLEPLKASLERYALRSAWNREQAQDIVQDAVMTAWREFHRFELGTDFRAWVFRIVVNTVYTFNKRTARDRRLTSPAETEDVVAVLERETTWASILENPERIRESLDERLADAIEELSIDEKQCLLLRLLEGFSYKEIAAFLDMPMGTVMSHVHRARMKLRERLADLGVERRLIGEPRS